MDSLLIFEFGGKGVSTFFVSFFSLSVTFLFMIRSVFFFFGLFAFVSFFIG